MELIITTTDKKLAYRSLTGTNVKQLNDCVGVEFELQHIIQGKSQKDDSEEKIVTCLISTNGDIYQTLSPTVADNMAMLISCFNIPDETVKVRVANGKSKNGRKFLQIEVV